ncbi:DUF4328 domain-containing protein [Streptomyces sp. H27-H5]|uniref:DUF4328 domain-containing protein n=1 Tax=Streptomyces sp. H27-H5 TaxID=2996460 RepID=UPI0022713FB3|nr:DUF4328 domain-containing protein [Streptomyces sp. H27-H5]MCY0956760.1 DUF4328 domain-containing protein [Streptomyces sp. H27-H5]
MGVCVLLAVVAAGDLFSLFVGARLHADVEGDGGFAFVSQDRLDQADRLFLVYDQIHVVGLAACAAAFITWFHRMRRNAGALAPDQFGKGPGWAIGAWFVPVAGFWMPYRIAVDMWSAGTRATPSAGPAGTSFWPVNLWWGSFAGSILLGWYANLSHQRAEELDALLTSVNLGMAAAVLNIVAAAAAAFFAVRLTRMLNQATGGSSR